MASPLVLSFIASLLPSAHAIEAISSILPSETMTVLISQSINQSINQSIDEETRMLLSSACSFLMILVFLIISHEPTSPFTLPGDRPIIKPRLKRVRLGHRVGPKQGRKLSAVTEQEEEDEQSINQLINQSISQSFR